MRVKQFLIVLLLVLILVVFNNAFLNTFKKANSYFASQSLHNMETVAPQKLFDQTWKIILKDYFEPSMNHQNWDRWKEHYKGKIITDDDAKVAIDTMIASLDEPYTRFMNKKEFNDLTTENKVTRKGFPITR